MTLRQPRIFISDADLAVIASTLNDAPYTGMGPALLRQELSRATVAPDRKLPADAARLGSTVQFLDNFELEIGETKLAPPGPSRTPGFSPVTSELGAALIGVRVGDTMRWRNSLGEVQAITVTRVFNKPPKAGARRTWDEQQP